MEVGHSKQPVVAVFNSHAHGDHWLGVEGIKRHYPKAVIYGHPVMKTRVQGPDGDFWLDTNNRLTGNTAEGKHVVAPDKTVNGGDEIKIGDTTFRIHHTGAAHTDNDIMIEVTGENRCSWATLLETACSALWRKTPVSRETLLQSIS